MALVTRSAKARLEPTSAHWASQIAAVMLVAGEALDPCAPCYIAAADGLVYMANGTAADEKARVVGWTGDEAYAAGDSVTLWRGDTVFQYDPAGGLTPGQPLYVAATAGRLDSAATTGGTEPVAQAITTQLIITGRHG